MWISEDGVAHTVAPPDWRDVIEINFGDLPPGRALEVVQWVESRREVLYDQISSGLLVSGPVGGLPTEPVVFDAGSIAAIEMCDRWLSDIDDAWKLDALDALELALEEWEESQEP
jgi:hypothetical protein